MSILIKDMEIPENCLSCPFQQWDGEDTICYFTGISALNIGRQETCPIIKIPPHGRFPIITNAQKFKEVFGFSVEDKYTMRSDVTDWLNKPYKEPEHED